jgi:hypothetical protein
VAEPGKAAEAAPLRMKPNKTKGYIGGGGFCAFADVFFAFTCRASYVASHYE